MSPTWTLVLGLGVGNGSFSFIIFAILIYSSYWTIVIPSLSVSPTWVTKLTGWKGNYRMWVCTHACIHTVIIFLVAEMGSKDYYIPLRGPWEKGRVQSIVQISREQSVWSIQTTLMTWPFGKRQSPVSHACVPVRVCYILYDLLLLASSNSKQGIRGYHEFHYRLLILAPKTSTVFLDSFYHCDQY